MYSKLNFIPYPLSLPPKYAPCARGTSLEVRSTTLGEPHHPLERRHRSHDPIRSRVSSPSLRNPRPSRDHGSGAGAGASTGTRIVSDGTPIRRLVPFMLLFYFYFYLFSPHAESELRLLPILSADSRRVFKIGERVLYSNLTPHHHLDLDHNPDFQSRSSHIMISMLLVRAHVTRKLIPTFRVRI